MAKAPKLITFTLSYFQVSQYQSWSRMAVLAEIRDREERGQNGNGALNMLRDAESNEPGASRPGPYTASERPAGPQQTPQQVNVDTFSPLLPPAFPEASASRGGVGLASDTTVELNDGPQLPTTANNGLEHLLDAVAPSSVLPPNLAAFQGFTADPSDPPVRAAFYTRWLWESVHHMEPIESAARLQTSLCIVSSKYTVSLNNSLQPLGNTRIAQRVQRALQ